MRLVPLLAAGLLLTACGGGSEQSAEAPTPTRVAPSEPATGRVTTADGSASLELPDGYALYGEQDLDGVVVLAATRARATDEQVFVGRFDDRGAAEDAAVYAATTVAGQGGRCARDTGDTTYGAPRLVVDCAFGEPEQFHKVFVVLGNQRRGALLTVQTAATSRAGTRDVVAPILASWRWKA